MKNTTSASTKQNTTASKTHALMVRIDGAGDIVTMTAKADFEMSAKTVDTRTREIVAEVKVAVLKDTVLHFVASDSLPGWYYICRVDSHDHVSCTCPSCTNRHFCDHMKQAWDAHKARKQRQEAVKIVPILAQTADKEQTNAATLLPIEEVKRLSWEQYCEVFDPCCVA